MGTAISELDMFNIEKFADRVIALAEYRQKLHNYLTEKMHAGNSIFFFVLNQFFFVKTNDEPFYSPIT